MRARISTEGWGRILLSAQDGDAHWGGNGDPFVPQGIPQDTWRDVGQPFTATAHVLSDLRLLGIGPSTPVLRETVRRLATTEWPGFGTRFWTGETEECINGRLLSDAVYLSAPSSDVRTLVRKLLDGEQGEGGWKCERESGSVRASFDSTVAVLEGLAAYERAEREERQGGRGEGETETETETEGEGPLISLDEVRAARTRAEAFLLQRHLYKRLSTGEPADRAYLELSDEPRWRYDILRGLEYFRSASILDDTAPDPRLADAIAHLRSLSEDGKWRVQRRFRGAAHYHVGEVGDFSPIITLRATIVLRWWNEAHK